MVNTGGLWGVRGWMRRFSAGSYEQCSPEDRDPGHGPGACCGERFSGTDATGFPGDRELPHDDRPFLANRGFHGDDCIPRGDREGAGMARERPAWQGRFKGESQPVRAESRV